MKTESRALLGKHGPKVKLSVRLLGTKKYPKRWVREPFGQTQVSKRLPSVVPQQKPEGEKGWVKGICGLPNGVNSNKKPQ